MTTNKQATLLTVYKKAQNPTGNSLYPSFTNKGGTVNVYFYNKPTPKSPAPLFAEMTLDDASPYVAGAHAVIGDSDYIAFETDTGSPVVNCKNLIV